MPALITHRLFGERALASLPAGLVDADDEAVAFLIANQGPDPFFFRVRSLAAPACAHLGRVMHRSRISAQLEALREGVSHLNPRDAGVGRAFALGMLGHYALDRAAHPFVYAQQWGIQRADRSLARAGSEVHAVIESDLDVLMLQRERDDATVADFPPALELEISPRVARVAGALLSFLARRVFEMDVAVSEYGGAVADMTLAYRAIEPAGAPLSSAIAGAEGIVREWSLLGSLAHRVTTEPPAGAGNLARRPWEDPFTGARSTESFPEVFERALIGYGRLAEGFSAGVAAAELTGHVNFSGRVLDASEECDFEEALDREG